MMTLVFATLPFVTHSENSLDQKLESDFAYSTVCAESFYLRLDITAAYRYLSSDDHKQTSAMPATVVMRLLAWSRAIWLLACSGG
jgi:hypothetical protein